MPRMRDMTGKGADRLGPEVRPGAVDLTQFDIPFDLNGVGRMTWLEFVADPAPWWTQRDAITIATYCWLQGRIHEDGIAPTAQVGLVREMRSLGIELGLGPKSRVLMGISEAGSSARVRAEAEEFDEQAGETQAAAVIPLDDLLKGQDV